MRLYSVHGRYVHWRIEAKEVNDDGGREWHVNVRS
jgi:hypothetical protein